MSKQKMRNATDGAAGLAIFALSLVAAGEAHTDVCVACTGPDANYACAIQGVTAPGDDARFKLLCITELAKAGGHQSCAASRAVTAPCPGEVKVIAAPGLDTPTFGGEPPAAPVPAATVAPVSPPAATPPPGSTETVVPKTTEPPKTVQQAVKEGAESAGETFEKTGESAAGLAKSAGGAVEKAGKAVGDAAKTTWKCLSTFFGDC